MRWRDVEGSVLAGASSSAAILVPAHTAVDVREVQSPDAHDSHEMTSPAARQPFADADESYSDDEHWEPETCESSGAAEHTLQRERNEQTRQRQAEELEAGGDEFECIFVDVLEIPAQSRARASEPFSGIDEDSAEGGTLPLALSRGRTIRPSVSSYEPFGDLP
jgi:hypothetical protein